MSMKYIVDFQRLKEIYVEEKKYVWFHSQSNLNLHYKGKR